MLQSLSTNDLEDNLNQNNHSTQAMQVQIAHEMSKMQEEPAKQAMLEDQAVNLQDVGARSAPCQNYGGKNGTPRTGVSSFPYVPPAGGGSKGPEPRNKALTGSGGRTARSH